MDVQYGCIIGQNTYQRFFMPSKLNSSTHRPGNSYELDSKTPLFPSSLSIRSSTALLDVPSAVPLVSNTNRSTCAVTCTPPLVRKCPPTGRLPGAPRLRFLWTASSDAVREPAPPVLATWMALYSGSATSVTANSCSDSADGEEEDEVVNRRWPRWIFWKGPLLLGMKDQTGQAAANTKAASARDRYLLMVD